MANPSDRDTAFLPMDGPQTDIPEVVEPDAKKKTKKPKRKKTDQDGNEGEDDIPVNPIPKYNKKITAKITGLTSKSTDIRCLDTLITSSTAL